MPPRTIRRISTAVLWVGVGLIAAGAVLPALAPSTVAGAPSSAASKLRSLSSDNGNPDQILLDEAAAVRRRVEEFRNRADAEDGHVGASRVLYLVGAFLALGGLVGRIAGERRRPDVEPH